MAQMLVRKRGYQFRNKERFHGNKFHICAHISKYIRPSNNEQSIDTDGSTLTVQKATYSAGAPSALLDYNKLVLGYYDSSGGFFASPNLTIAGMNLPASPGQGDLIYYYGSAWTLLSPGTAGQLLATEGSTANPQWVTPASRTSSASKLFYCTGSGFASDCRTGS